MTNCPTCGQALSEERGGVRLTPLKARIFDVIKRAGPDGIESDDLFAMIFAERNVVRATLRAHIWQINDILSDTGLRIESANKCFRLITNDNWKKMWEKPFDHPEFT